MAVRCSLSRSGRRGSRARRRVVALGDVDGDGDLDLVCGNNAQNATLYLNDGGILQLFPAWSSGPADNTRDVALGDIDRDGDLDLVCGNNGQTTKLYAGEARSPPSRGIFFRPLGTSPTTGRTSDSCETEKAGPESYRVHFTARDVESDPIWVVPEYQYEGDPTWHPAVVVGETGKAGPFATSPAGVADSIEWDTHLLPFDARDVILRLRVVEIPKRVSVIQHVAPYLHEVGPCDAVPSGDLDRRESVVSRGDVGRHRIRGCPCNEPGGGGSYDHGDRAPDHRICSLEETFPIVIAPKASADLTISLTPSDDADVQGTLVISSDDPFTPAAVVEVTADVRPLDFTLVNSYPTGEIAQETPLAVSVVMQNYVHVDSARVSYREGGRTEFDALRLQRLDDPVNEQYYGSVPAVSITARGSSISSKSTTTGSREAVSCGAFGLV